MNKIETAKQILDRTLETTNQLYFNPYSFESTSLYEKLGIRGFKKYMPTTGDWVERNIWKKNPYQNQTKMNTSEKLKFQIFATKMLEIGHFPFFYLFGSGIVEGLNTDNYAKAGLQSIALLGVGIYPVVLQRYNRMRYTKILNKLQNRNQTPI